MAATPYVCNLVYRCADGFQDSIFLTGSDVTTEELVAPDGTDFVHLPANHGDVAIIDMVFSAAGVDCRSCTINVNGKQIPVSVIGAANVGNVVSRQFQSNPLLVAAGAQLEFVQLT